MIPDFTIVLGVDAKHLEQLRMVFPTWKKHKPNTFLNNPIIVFYDKEEVFQNQIFDVIDNPNLTVYPWPPPGITYEGNEEDKFTKSQRYKMLSGFVYIPALLVKTSYWLKLDTDTIATGQDDWIDSNLFIDKPAIISQRWSFTKPPDQMMVLDKWVKDNKNKKSLLSVQNPLNLVPNPGEGRLNHKRIISWCSFFETGFTRLCAAFASETCGDFKLPVPSQDGYVWYVAKRLGLNIVRTNFKSKGFKHRSTFKNIKQAVEEAING